MRKTQKLDYLNKIAITKLKNGINDFIKFKLLKGNTENINIKKGKFTRSLRNNKIEIDYKINNIILFIFYFLIFIVCISKSQENLNIRKINSLGEILLTVPLENEKQIQILSNSFTCLPDTIEINGNKYIYPNETNTDKIFINVPSGNNIIKLIFNTPPSNLKNMFDGIRDIKKIDFSGFDSSNAQDLSYMFNSCQDLEEINFTGFKTSLVTKFEGMFQFCTKLTSLDLSSFDTSKATTMNSMFSNCEGLQFLNLKNFETSNVYTMFYMFKDCKKLENIDLSNFVTNEVNMGGMFENCYN